jgi:hypothetical protein
LSRRAASSIRSRVSSRTGPLWFKARDTVATDTPASSATSLIVTVMSRIPFAVLSSSAAPAGADSV